MVEVYQNDGAVATLGGEDSLDGHDALLGFACEVSAVLDSERSAEAEG